MKTIANALAQYIQDHGVNTVPLATSLGTPFQVTDLASSLVPTYIGGIPNEDGWGNPFTYVAETKDAYTLKSPGRNGGYEQGATRNDRNWDHDLLISNGFFIASPESG